MARGIHRLAAAFVSKVTVADFYHDGAGLYLQVEEAGQDERGKPRVTKSWIFRYTLGKNPKPGKSFGKPWTRYMGLGPFPDVGLAEARDEAAKCRQLVRQNIHPIEHRKEQQQATALAAARSVTFKSCGESYIESHKAGWRNAQHGAQWSSTLETYVYPIIGTLPVQSIDTALVLKCLEPMWKTKVETASRVRGRIESILDWAKARGYRQGDNPARWRGHLDNLLPKRSKVQKVEHHPALPYSALPAFMAALREQEGTNARALEFAILTTARSGEVIGAKFSEIDIREKIWTVPADRMKAHREHRSPLSARALEIVEEMKSRGATAFLFPGIKPGRPMGKTALGELTNRMKQADGTAWCDRHGNPIVPHGFRSTFSDWATERTNFPSEVRDMALAHTIGDKVEAAYRRGDLFDKRRNLAEKWAEYCASPPLAPSDKVVALKTA